MGGWRIFGHLQNFGLLTIILTYTIYNTIMNAWLYEKKKKIWRGAWKMIKHNILYDKQKHPGTSQFSGWYAHMAHTQ